MLTNSTGENWSEPFQDEEKGRWILLPLKEKDERLGVYLNVLDGMGQPATGEQFKLKLNYEGRSVAEPQVIGGKVVDSSTYTLDLSGVLFHTWPGFYTFEATIE